MMELLLRLTLCLLALLAPAAAQYAQDYIAQNIPSPIGPGTIRAYFYRPTQNHQPIRVIELDPEYVYITYNCYYMKDICKNAYNFMQTDRGKRLHTAVVLPNNVFGYDFNTGKDSSKRSYNRREHSCPKATWKENHPCPETDQKEVMRHNGPWFTRELEPGTNKNEIMNRRDSQGRVVEQSGVRYSCDEFPAATWVEGGDWNQDRPSETRCAAVSCKTGVKAEQTWQGMAHSALRREMRRVIRRRQQQFGHFNFFDNQQSIVWFGFLMENNPNGVAARITVYDDPFLDNVGNEYQVTQAKRRSANSNTTASFGWRLTTERLAELVKMGHAYETTVSANDSMVGISLSDLTGTTFPMAHMSNTGLRFRWDLDNEDEDEDDFTNTTVRQAARHVQRDFKPVPSKPALVPRSAATLTTTPRLRAASAADIQKAREVVEKAIAESSRLNQARLANPLRNNYRLKPGTVVGQRKVQRRWLGERAEDDVVPPLLEITDEMADAAALIAEAEATELAGNVTRRAAAAAGTYWMEGIARKGTVPWGDDPSYVVFRNVRDYGARGDGVTDDTKAIKEAMNDGKRCAAKCNGSTVKNAIVYFPPGTYLVSSTIPLPFGTQVIGDANDRPKLVASRSFIGSSVLSVNEYTGGGKGPDGLDQQWYVNTANFYRQLRNMVIDVTATRASQQVSCLHYQVAQATSLQNVELIAGPSQRGIFAENGSGGQISDVTFRGGAVGLYGGNQQFTAQRLTFDGCTVGVHLIWDWGWVWKSITMTNVGTGFKLVPEATNSGNIGSVSFLDSSFTNVQTVVQMEPPSTELGSGTTGVILENVVLSGVGAAVADTNGKVLLDGSSTSKIDHWALGPVYKGSASANARTFSNGGKVGNYRRPATLLDANGAYFERPKPQYEDRGVGDFVHVKDFGARGDGVTDDTAAFQAALYASQGKILFVDAGSYILTSTVTIPSGSKIVGETWSQLVATGSYFEDAKNPKVLIKVGNPGDVGSIELQDLLFTTRGPTAGAILVEWNIEAESPGSAGLWDCHVRIGGATGTELTPAECPATHGVDPNRCSAGSLMMHITRQASGYFENMWLLLADHMIDDPDLEDANNTMVQTSIYVARGLLVESVKPTWLYGTGSEHAVYYQYNFHRARNIFAGMLQTESPYYQPVPPPPVPFADAVGVFPSDPVYECGTTGHDFDGCDESWAVVMRECQNIFVAGAGLYSWFSDYTQECIDQHACQKALVLLDSNYGNVRFQHLITIGAKYMVVMDGKGILATDNLAVEAHPRWSQISVLDVASDGTQFGDLVWIDPIIWDMDPPRFTCSPPCHIRIPSWTRATSTVNYPLITVSDGTWTSTITKPPLTITQWVFEPVTLTSAPGARKRQGFEEFWPVLATTPFWPAVTYTGIDGEVTTTSPTVAFPAPPRSIGPDAPPPPGGSWPKRAIQPIMGDVNEPSVSPCYEWDFQCLDMDGSFNTPWNWGNLTTDELEAENDDFDENWDEAQTTCLTTESTTTTPTRTTTRPTATQADPIPSPKQGDPRKNEVDCYNSGQKTEHIRLDNTAHSACRDLGEPGMVLPGGFSYHRTFNLPSSFFLKARDANVSANVVNAPAARAAAFGLGVEIVVSLDIADDCQWTYDYDECRRYLSVPVDSCDCGGVDGKQGGVVRNDCYFWRIDPNTAW